MIQTLEHLISNNDAALVALYQVLLFNGRALALLSLCLLVLRVIKVSAASKHFFITVAITTIVLIPLTSQLLPAVDIVIDTNQPELLEALTYDSSRFSAVISSQTTQHAPYAAALLFAYFIVSALLVLKVFFDNLKMLILLKLSSPVKQTHWVTALNRHSTALNIHRKVKIVHSPLIYSPSTWGVFKPVIFIPSNATQWPNHLIQSTLLHELAHIKRFDCFTQQLTKLVCALYWVNPICWKAFNTLCSHAETACDNAAIHSGVHKTNYANDLLHVAEHVHQHSNHNFALLNMASKNKQSQLSDRILTILNPASQHAPMSKVRAYIIFFAITGLFLPLASLRANFVERVHIKAPIKRIAIAPTIEERVYRLKIVEPPSQIEETSTTELTEVTQLHPISPSDFINKVTTKIANNVKPKILQQVTQLLPPKELTPEETTLSTLKVEVASSIEAPIIIQQHQKAIAQNLIIPKYPRKAQSRGIEGEITVEYSLDKYGKVINAQVIATDAPRIFDRTVLSAIKKSTFSPSTLNGQPIATNGLKEKYVFVLKS